MQSSSKIGVTCRALILATSALSAPAFAQGVTTAAPPAAGQATETPADNGLQEIIVTAQKRDENLQKVPIAVTALSAKALADRTVQNIADLKSVTPNVNFSTTAAGSTTYTVGIRGIKSSDVQLSVEQPVATYVDGVFQASALGSSILLGPDISRIEILRGPQGTLFGRNSVGGAVNIVTQQPEYKLTARAMVGAGNKGFMEAQGTLNVPIVDGVAALRVNVGYDSNNGFTRDLTSGSRLGQQTDRFVRAQLRLDPTDRLNILLRGDYTKTTGGGNVIQGVFLTPSSATVSAPLTYIEGAIESGLVPIPANYAAVNAAYLSCGNGPTPNFQPKCYSAIPSGPHVYYREYGGSATVSYQLGGLGTVKSITAYRKFLQDSAQDYDASTINSLYARAQPRGNTFTQEVQLVGSAIDTRLKYALGFFYYDFVSHDDGISYILPVLLGPAATAVNQYGHKDSSVAPYAQATFAIVPTVRITAGARYTTETKKLAVSQFAPNAGNLCTIPFPNTQCLNTAKNSYSDVDYTAGIDWDVTPTVLLYAKTSKGFQAGGINQRSSAGVNFIPFKPETATTYEAGLKSELFDRRLRLNIAAFHTLVNNKQENVPVVTTAGVVVSTINAATARVNGFEVEGTLIPFAGATLSGSVGYTDAKYTKFVAAGAGGPGTLDLSGNRFVQTPKWTVGVSPSYEFDVGFGKIRGQVDYFYQSSEDLAPVYTAPLVVPGDVHVQAGYSLVNARLSLTVVEDTEIALWGKNLTDTRYFTSALDQANSLGFTNAKVGNPRTFGIQISHAFR